MYRNRAQALNKEIAFFNTPIGKIQAPTQAIHSLLQKLKQHPMNLGELLNLPEFHQQPVFLIETLFLMMHEQYLYPVWPNDHWVDPNHIQDFNQMLNNEGLNLSLVPGCATPIHRH